MASNLSPTQRAIYFTAPAVGWMTAGQILLDAGLPKGARPRVYELRQMGYLRHKLLPSGRYGYQRAPVDLEGGE